jgi:hypothetical protein
MKHPFEKIKPNDQKNCFIILLIVTILVMAIMNIIGSPLTTANAPSGIISFELAVTPARAQEIISSWNTDAQLRAAFIQGLDFLFPLIYSSALGLGCLITARILSSRGKPGQSIGRLLAWGLLLAAACDYLENIALVAELFGWIKTPFPQIAAMCAVIKFSMILLSIGYILFGLVIRIFTREIKQYTT